MAIYVNGQKMAGRGVVVDAIPLAQRGAAGGVATLDADGVVRELPSGLVRAIDGDVDESLNINADTLQGFQASAFARAPKSALVTLPVAAWDSETLMQTVTVTGVLAGETSQIIDCAPTSASQSAYYDSVVVCTASTTNRLTFSASFMPENDLSVFVVLWPL